MFPDAPVLQLNLEREAASSHHASARPIPDQH